MEYFGFDKTIGGIESFGFIDAILDGVDPDVPIPSVSEPLKFTTINSRGSSELPLLIEIYEPGGEWSLKELGVVVADHTGFYDTSKTSWLETSDQNQKTTIALKLIGSPGSNKDYELLGPASNVKLSYTASGSSSPEGVVTVSSFSTLIESQRFSLDMITLTVPDSLPREVTSLEGMFRGCTLFNQPISNWDTSNVTNMSYLFFGCRSFNQPIGNWDTSNVTNMSSLFRGAEVFNQPIGNWDTSNVTNMYAFIYEARNFNQDISMFDVSKVTSMNYFAQGAYNFGSNLSNWCVSLIPTTPTNFGRDTRLTAAKTPKWGSCPNRPSV